MHLIRILLVCLACLSAALLPARASAACPMQMQSTQMHAPMQHHHHPSCPAPMTCCVPMAVHLATPSVTPARAATRRPQALVLRDRIGEDAARLRLLRPPTSA